MSLRLGTLLIAPLTDREIRAFADEQRAREHICDHLLTLPEAHFWRWLLPYYPRDLKDGNDADLGSFATRLWTARPAVESQLLYDSYVETIRQAIAEAVAEGWYWLQDSPGKVVTWCGLGRTGIYVISDPVKLRTAMLPGYTVPAGSGPPVVARSVEARPRRGVLPSLSLPQDSELSRYALFERSVQRVRREYFGACYHRRMIRGGAGIGLLCSATPPFESWQTSMTGTDPKDGGCNESGQGE